MKNWKTTLAGLIVGIPQLLIGVGLVDGNNKYLTLITALGGVVLGLFAKDNNVTGGTVHQ